MIIQWCNENNGFIQAILIFVYVVATIFICVANLKLARASKKQLDYQRKHDEDVNRARVVPSLRILEGDLICLCFSNIGHELGTNLKITFDDEWLQAYKQLPINNSTIERFLVNARRIGDNPFLPPDRSYEVVVFVCMSTEFIKLDQLPKVEITCSVDSGGKHYDDKYAFFIRPNGSLTLTTDYVRLEKKKADSLEKISKSLGDMERDAKFFRYKVEAKMEEDESGQQDDNG